MANSIVRALVTVEGTRPLLQCHIGEETFSLEKKERKGVAGRNPEEWKSTCMLTEEGQLYFPPTYIFGCLRNGARLTKKGRGSYQSDIQSTLQVEETGRLLINRWVRDINKLAKTTELSGPKDKKIETYIFVSPVVNPATRARNIRYRLAASAGWKLQFSISWDRNIVPTSIMETIIIDSGKFGGLGDGIKIGFGRFDVVKYELELPPDSPIEEDEMDFEESENGYMEIEEDEPLLKKK